MNQLAKAITSTSAVTLGLLIIITAMVFETQTLLFEQLKQVEMDEWKIWITSFGLAIGIEFIILLFTANANYVGKFEIYEFEVSIPQVYGVASFIINFYFWEAYDFSIEWQWIVFRIFISLLLAYINYSLSELFVSKWSAHVSKVENDVKLAELKVKYSELQVKIADKEEAYNIQHNKIAHLKSVLDELEVKYRELENEASEMRQKLTRKPRKSKTINN